MSGFFFISCSGMTSLNQIYEDSTDVKKILNATVKMDSSVLDALFNGNSTIELVGNLWNKLILFKFMHQN